MGQEPEALRADIEARRENMSETIDAIGDRVSPSRIAQRRVDKAKGWAGNVKVKVMGSPQPSVSSYSAPSSPSGVDHVKDAALHAKESVGNVPASVGRSTGGNPLVAGVIAFGLGAMIASLLPETEAEKSAVEKVQPQIDAAAHSVADSGHEALDTAKEAAQGAVADLKDTATTKAQEVKSQATDAAAEVKQQASSSS